MFFFLPAFEIEFVNMSVCSYCDKSFCFIAVQHQSFIVKEVKWAYVCELQLG